jgi:hypothetical protein
MKAHEIMVTMVKNFEIFGLTGEVARENRTTTLGGVLSLLVTPNIFDSCSNFSRSRTLVKRFALFSLVGTGDTVRIPR